MSFTQKIQELNRERSDAMQAAKVIVDRAVEEKREMTEAEYEKAKELRSKGISLGNQVQRLKLSQDISNDVAELSQPEERSFKPKDGLIGGGPSDAEQRAFVESDQYRSAFSSYCSNGPKKMNESELRALSMGVGPQGGYLIPSKQSEQIEKELKNKTFIRQLCRVIQQDVIHSFDIPFGGHLDKAHFGSETATATDDGEKPFQMRKFSPNRIWKRVDVTRPAFQGGKGMEDFMMDAIGYSFAQAEEYSAMIGTGSNEFLGLFTPSDQGISTSRDISTGNTTSKVTAKGLNAAKMAVKPGFREPGVWVFSNTVLTSIYDEQDLDGRPLFMPDYINGGADRILGRPVYESEYAPSSMTTGDYVGLYLDPKQYFVVDFGQYEMMELQEEGFKNNKISFIAQKYSDANIMNPQAVARVTLA